jgi:hypothetical protein
MRPRVAALGLSLAVLAGMAVPGLGAEAPPAQRTTARKLVRLASEACAGALQAVEATGPPQARLLPLHDALIRMQSTLVEVGSRLAAHDALYYQALSRGTRTLAELSVLWPRTGLPEAQKAERQEIEARMRGLSNSYGRLRNRYGREWLRYTTGRPLDDAERRRFARVQAGQAVLVDTLSPLLERVRTRGDRWTVAELALLLAQAYRVAQAPPTLDEMLNASVLSDTMAGEYAATRAANPADDPEWNDADQEVEQIQTDASVGFVFTANLDTLDGIQQWSLVEGGTDLPAGSVDAVGQVTGATGTTTAGALDDSLSAPFEPEDTSLFDDGDQGEDGTLDAGAADSLDEEGADGEDVEPLAESPVDNPEILELPDDEVPLAESAEPDSNADGVSAAPEAAGSQECTPDGTADGCGDSPIAVPPPPQQAPPPPAKPPGGPTPR